MSRTRPSAVNDAIDLARGGRMDGAVRVCYETLALDDRDARIHALLATLMLELGCDDEAIAAATRAIELDSACTPAYLALGLAYDRSATTRGQALLVWHELAELMPDLPEAHIQLAEACGALDMDDDAEESWERALALDPQSLRALWGRALVALRREGVRPALEHVRAAGEIDPQHDAFVLSLARRAATAAADEAVAAHAAAIEALAADDALEALREVRSALAIDAGDALALALASVAFQRQGSDHEALATALRALEINSNLPVTLAVLAQALGGWPGLARRRARVIIALVKTAPGEPLAHVLLAESLLGLARFEHAERAYRNVLRLDAGSVRARYGLAIVRLIQGSHADSALEARRAAALHIRESGLAWRLFDGDPAGEGP
jgi:tetratricopeptide (TPR) repeat protein